MSQNLSNTTSSVIEIFKNVSDTISADRVSIIIGDNHDGVGDTSYSKQDSNREQINSNSLSASGESILTRITNKQSDCLSNDDSKPICIELYEESITSEFCHDDAHDFVPNLNPGIEEYMKIVKKNEDDLDGWERYPKECHKFSLPTITAVKECLCGESTILDLSVSIMSAN